MNTRAHASRLRLVLPALFSTFVLSSGCATYAPQPLPQQASLATDLGELVAEDAGARHGPTKPYDLTFSDGLDLTEVGILAVLHNPGLQAERARLQIATAQAFAAGLLPDPVLNAGMDIPTSSMAGLVNGWSLGLSYDILPLITRGARVTAAREEQRHVRLDLLWREWQVIQYARSLAARMQLEDQRLSLLREMRVLHQERYDRSARALQAGDVTLDVNGTDLTALIDTLSQISDLQQARNETHHNLCLLLGLDAGASITLTPLVDATPLQPELVKARLAKLPQIRPDFLALQAGYASQEATVRAAILAQFPSLSVDIVNARDTGNINSVGPSINLSLPTLNRNRGEIAIERATRDQLRAEYTARLAQAMTDVDRLLKLQDILQQQQHALQTYVPQLKSLVDRARNAYEHGDIDALTFLNMESTWVTKRLDQLALLQASWENRIALEALLAFPSYSGECPPGVCETQEASP